MLVLRERVFRDDSELLETPSRLFEHNCFGPSLPEDMDSFTEGRIAKQLAYQKLRNLRLIAVGDYKF